MPIPLSDRTTRLAQALFEEPLRTRVVDALVESVSENIPFCEDRDAEGMERIRFAVMKLIHEDEKNFSQALDLARIDWRDLFMSAGFGHDTEAHRHWFRKIAGGQP